ncbi:MAG: plasmid replication protein, CyRepA1 family [Cyanobacteria bacterium P01_F01_bin.86]
MNTLTDTDRDRRSVGIVQHPDPSTANSLDSFAARIHSEWTEGSGVAEDLVRCSVSIVPDLELSPGGEVSTPIHDALGWHYARFGERVKANQYAALLHTHNPDCNWDVEVFQAKLSDPVFDRKKGKLRKYESPKGFGVRGGFSPIPDRLWMEIAARHSADLACSLSQRPKNGQSYEFWQWVADRPSIDITITEGLKKAQHLLSQGRVCIALSGITMGVFSPDGTGKRLRPYLELFARKDRRIFIAFDAETKPKTLRDVRRESRKLGQCFTDAGCKTFILDLPLLPDTDKTGIDDFGVARGSEAIDRLYKEAVSFASWLWHVNYRSQRTYSAWLELDSDRLQLDDLKELPSTGTVILESPKGSGKTHAISKLVGDAEKVVLLTHRVCLGRNLAERLRVDWKADLDKGNGRWIADGDRTTQRIALCVDSLLAVDPKDFWGCQLVIDEVDQVFHHLLASSTCNKDGKRPALLARLHELIQVSQRTIAASADITDAEIDYLQTLKGKTSSVYLIRNSHQPSGYSVRWLDCSSKAGLVAELLQDVRLGLKVFVATDARSDSKAIAQLVRQLETVRPDLQVLLINSETSGGEFEVEFIRNINQQVTDFDVVISTPSMATGVSIEVEHFDKVYGLFTGVLPDGDIAQALARVRPAIPRVVWCVSHGKNFSKVSRSEYPIPVKQAVQTQWDRETRLIRTSLRPDISPIVDEEYGWQDNPHLVHWSRIVARTNGSMWNLRSNAIERLQWEGNSVEVVSATGDEESTKQLLAQARQQTKRERCEAIASAPTLSSEDLKALKTSEGRTPAQLLSEQHTRIAEFYGVGEVTPELVEMDNGGRLRGQIVELESLLLGKEFAVGRDEEALSRQAKWQKGVFLPDQPCNELRRFVREQLKLSDYLDPKQEWSDADLQELGQMARRYAKDIQQSLGFSIPADPELASNGWIYRRLLQQLGIKVSVRRQGGRREQVKLYFIAPERWEFLQEVLAKREERRLLRQLGDSQTVLTPLFKYSIQEGVNTPPNSPQKVTSTSESSPFRLEHIVQWLGNAGEWIIRHVGVAKAQLQRPEGGKMWTAALSELRPSTS